MMQKLLYLLFFCSLLHFATAGIPHNIDLNGSWEFRQAGTAAWYPASVPGCVQLDLLKNRIIPDPFYRTNEDSVQWVATKDWEYRRVFFAGPEMLSSGHIDLVFEGLDTYAKVFLNDSLLIATNNMFREWKAENIKRMLKPGNNVIRVLFLSVINQNNEIYSKLNIKLPGDEKVVCRKAAYNFGWDWGPKLVTMGLWKPVYLSMYRNIELQDARFIQKKLSDSAAFMSGVFTIYSDTAVTAIIRVDNDSIPLATHSVSLNKGKNIIRLDFIIRNPKLWWPNGMGSPFLYPLNYYCFLADEMVGKGRRKVGLRTIELKQEKDSIGDSFTFLVNHMPVFIKGANYIPQDNFPSRVADSTYRTLLEEVKSLNMNMLRVWGGGIYEKDIFYDLCDESGIMIWQDFMFACAVYPGSREFLQNADIESAQNIVRLRNHPCLALWCGNNEIDEGWKNWGWIQQYNYTPLDSALVYQGYKDLFTVVLRNNVEHFDTLRPYIASSPLFGWGRPESRRSGDMHYWGVWWGKYPFSVYKENTGRFMSEYGFQAFPDISSLRQIARPGDLQPGSAVMKVHQKHPTGYETIDEYLIREFKRPADFESYAYVSQVLQAEGIKTAIEAHRRAMPRCMGTLFWQYNDCWPVVSWSARDYYGSPKALHFYLQKEFNDMLVSPVIEKGRLRVYVISDRSSATRGILRIRITDFNGKVLRDSSQRLTIARLTSSCRFDADSSSFMKGIDPCKVVLTALFITEDGGHQQYRNSYYFVPVKDLALEKSVITKELTEIPGGYKITLRSGKLARNVWLSSDITGKFLKNYEDIMPGEPLEIFFMTSYKHQDLPDKIRIRSIRDTY
ncbi:MAG: glycoside hydrolase family 2 protein [Bacteroidota bacterium]